MGLTLMMDIHYHLLVEYEYLNPKLLEWEEINNSSPNIGKSTN